MIRVSSTDFAKEIDRYQDAALTQPVIVTRDGRDWLVMISAEEYARLTRRDRRVFRTEDLTDEEVEQIASVRMDSRHAHLDDELKDS
jgi:PHD/YefM family antitoxin component YafN of YafNO toxin-antitoxin module